MNQKHWIVNHFVPAVAYIHSETLCMQTSTEKMPLTQKKRGTSAVKFDTCPGKYIEGSRPEWCISTLYHA